MSGGNGQVEDTPTRKAAGPMAGMELLGRGGGDDQDKQACR